MGYEMAKSAMELVQEAKATISEVSVEQAKAMLQNGSLVIDVRELAEFEAGHLPNAEHIPRGVLEFMISNHPAFEDTNNSIIVYCKTGGRSALATATLLELGYANVHSMQGGYQAWL